MFYKNGPPRRGLINKAPPFRIGRWSIEWTWNVYAPVLILLAVKLIIDYVPSGPWAGWTVSPGDPTYNKPLESDLIPSWANNLLSILGPALIIPCVLVVSALFYQRRVGLSLYLMDIHNSWIGLISSWFLTSIVVKSLKLTLGQPKPTFNTDGARESFPSGHSATASMGFVFLAMYIAGKFFVYYNKRGARRPTSWITMGVICLFLSVPIIVGVTRIRDFSHFPIDVYVGIIIGAIISIGIYRTLFKWPWEKESWVPLQY
jgi:diacylglycerol diphosphate phosphatase / phosphatidate phosphatase